MDQERRTQILATAPVVALGIAATTASAAVDVVVLRVVLEVVAVLAVAAATAWVATPAEGSATAIIEPLPERQVQAIAKDRRKPTFDRETGLHAEWYFRLRVEEEIARARRYGQAFALLVFSTESSAALDVARVATKQFLREVDFAGDLGDGIVICLPNTPRDGAEQVISRLTKLVKDLDVRIAEYPNDGETMSALIGRPEWGAASDIGWAQQNAA